MKTIWLVLAIVASAVSGMAQPEPQAAAEVHGRGCVQPGVEAGCLVVKEVESGKLYSLLIQGRGQPALGSGIEFSGAPFKGMTACMQGAPVSVSHWEADDSLKCHADLPPQE
jgi:hypothetical protein